MKQETGEITPRHEHIIIQDELDMALEVLEEDILNSGILHYMEISDFPYIDFDVDEYFEQPPPSEFFPDTDEELTNDDVEMIDVSFERFENNEEESINLSRILLERQHRRNPVELLDKHLRRVELQNFFKYVEETTDEDPFGLERLFQENKGTIEI